MKLNKKKIRESRKWKNVGNQNMQESGKKKEISKRRKF